MNLYIDGYNCRISVNGNKLILTNCTDVKTFHIGNIDSVSRNKNVQITSQAICKLSEENINVSWFLSNQMICQTSGSKNIFRLKQQFDLLNNEENKLNIAKKNIYAKIHNQMHFIDNQEHLKIRDINKVNSTESLLGIEGTYAAYYFSKLKNLFPKKYNFKSRQKHPPKDPVNSVLSFAYTLLYNQITSVISSHGLNPSIGFMHNLKNNHYALSSDLMESLRCDICDNIASKYLLNHPIQMNFSLLTMALLFPKI